MDTFFSLLFFFAFVLGILGLIKPAISLFWYKGIRTRKLSSILFFGIALLAFIGVGVTMPKEAFEQANAATTETTPPPKQASIPVTKTTTQVKATPKPLTETEIRRALARNCDTTFDFLEDPNLFTGDTGYIKSAQYINSDVYTDESGKLKKANWDIYTYKQTGPNKFDEDFAVKVPIFQKVRLVSKNVEESRGLWSGYVTVAPVGSDKLYIINAHDFTLKEITRCNFIQKAKNGIVTKAAYIPTNEAGKRPVSTYYGQEWIDVPKDAILIVTGYDESGGWIEASVFDKKTRNLVKNGLFHPATLTEIK